nr:retrovirus-related Pol polyprotein from transposon TNT 1-94 [Tanacetum cinerariifolium]
MTWNKAYLADYQEINDEGFVAFGSSIASIDVSNLWHRRLGHVNFKIMNKLVKGNLVRGLPSKIFENDHTFVACQKEKQHKATSRTMLADSLLHITFWAKAINTACYLLNRALVTKPHNKTPYELLNGRLPRLDFMRPFGYPVTILNTLDPLGKFQGKADEGFWLGNQTEKNAGPQDTNGNAGTQDNVDEGKETIVEPVNKEDRAYKDELDKLMSQEKEASDAVDSFNKDFEQGCMDQRGAAKAGSTNSFNTVSNPVNAASSSGTFSAGGPSSPHPDAFILDDTLLHTHSPLQFKVWVQRLTLTTWNLPLLKKAIRTKWVYMNKKDERGIVVRNKARLVAQGNIQEEWIDYDDVFAPVARIEAIGIFLAFASFMGFIVYQMDVYVDNIIFGSTKKSLCDEFKALMHKIFQMSSMRELTFFLGMQAKQSEEGIFISQISLWYPKDSLFNLEAYSDSDYARANLDRKSITGGCQFLGRRLILWQCKKQTIVATSTTEVEYVAAANCCGQREGSSSGPECQETIGGVMARITLEGAPIQSNDPPISIGNTVGSREDRMEHAIKLMDHVPQTPHDSPLSGGHTPGSDEGSMTLKELMDLCTTLSQKVLDLEKVKTAQAKVIASLKKRVTKLEQRQSSRISGFHPFRADIDDMMDEEMIVEDKGSGAKGGSIAETVSTARLDISAARPKVSTAEPKTPPTTTTLFDDEDVTIADILVKMKSQKAKEKGVAFKDVDDSARPIRSITTLQPFLTIDLKDKAKLYDEVQVQIDADHELAARLTHEEQEKYTVEERSKLIAEFFERRKKQLAKERVEAIWSKPPTESHLRNLMMTYLKHTGRFTHAQLKIRIFEEIQKLYTKEQKWVDAFVPIGSEKDEKRVRSRKKRASSLSLKQKSPKKQKVNDQESIDSDKEIRKCLKVVLDDDKAINYETLDVKSLIFYCESQVLGTMEASDVHVYKHTRLDGSYRHFLTFFTMLKVLDRQDVWDFHKIVLEWFPANDLEVYNLILWGDLKTLVESSKDDEIWRNQQD